MNTLQVLGIAFLCNPGLEELGILMSCIAMEKKRQEGCNLDLGGSFGYWNASRFRVYGTEKKKAVRRKR